MMTSHPPREQREQDAVAALLREGIAAAKAGDRVQASQLLSRVTALDAHNVQAWLWLSSVVAPLEDRAACLERVLALAPDHAAARRGLQRVRQTWAAELVAEACAATERGDLTAARQWLRQAVALDEGDVTAWLLLSRLVPARDERAACLAQVLALDPDNVEAQIAWAAIKAEQATSAAEASLPDGAYNALFNPWAVDPEVSPSPRSRHTFAASVLGEEFVDRHQAPDELPSVSSTTSPTAEIWAKYQDELRCPYCGARTAEEDPRCPACEHRLWIEELRREEGSAALWSLFSIYAFLTVIVAVAPLLILFVIGLRVGVDDFTQLLPLYFGDGLALPAEIRAVVLTQYPPWLFFLSWAPFFLFLSIVLGIYLRWTQTYYVLWAISGVGVLLAGLMLFAGTASLIKIVGGMALGILLTTVGLMFNAADDFSREKTRLLLRVDESLESGKAYLAHGQRYASQEMWALAALYFRRATARLPYHLAGFLALAVATIHLEELTLASQALEDARRIDPDAPQVAELEALLEEKRAVADVA